MGKEVSEQFGGNEERQLRRTSEFSELALEGSVRVHQEDGTGKGR